MEGNLRVLLFGGGAREHALAYKISTSSLLLKLYLCRPNDGFAHLGEEIEFDNYKSLAQTAKEIEIDLLVVGPEDPLSEGIVDEFKLVGIPAIGADKKWARLESSKSFAKDFMDKNNIPTAKFEIITATEQIKSTLDKFSVPVVIKADGLAAGKGVHIASSKIEADTVINDFLNGKYGDASKKIVVEEFLEGEEISLISIWDGKTLLPFVPARDYKRLEDGNNGPNTGGMGSYCPVMIDDYEKTSIQNYLTTLETALINNNADFSGIIYSGLILTKQGIKILEYNMRFGDPETQALMLHLKTDILEVFKNAVNQKLNETKLSWKEGSTICLVIASDGYPINPKNNCKIINAEEIQEKYNLNVFYAGVKLEDNSLLSNGGRVLSICKSNARNDVYSAAQELIFNDKFYRTDIGEGINEGIADYSRI